MESPNPMWRLIVFSRIKKMIHSYMHSVMDETDKRLVRGLFDKHIKDFDED